jgi:apolipoprotein N-acyltransferase
MHHVVSTRVDAGGFSRRAGAMTAEAVRDGGVDVADLRARGRRAAGALAPPALGALLGVAFEPVAWPFVIPVCIAGLTLLLKDVTARRAALRAAAFGIGFMLSTLAWLWPSIGIGAWLALSLVQGLWFAPLGWGLILVRHLPAWPVWSATLWTAVETLRGRWPFGGFPWSRLGMAVVDTPWAQLLPLLGIGGTGLLLALLGFLLAALLESATVHDTSVRISATVLAAVLALTFLPAALARPVDESRTVTVAIVQGGVPGNGTDLVSNHRRFTRNQREATVQLASRIQAGEERAPDLVIWPENSTAVDPFTDPEARDAIEASVAAIERPVLVGAVADDVDPRRVLNQGIVWDPATGPGERYTKRHPVPFGEYIPFRRVLGGINSRLAEIPRDMMAGGSQPPLEVAGTAIAVAICFDVAFDDVLPEQVRDGAELIVVQTSNAMFTGTAQRAQQFAISRARAVETGRSVVVASTNGISGVIAPDGTVAQQSSTRGTEVLVATVPLVSVQTFAVRMRPMLSSGVLVVAVGALLAGLRRRSRTRRVKSWI